MFQRYEFPAGHVVFEVRCDGGAPVTVDDDPRTGMPLWPTLRWGTAPTLRHVGILDQGGIDLPWHKYGSWFPSSRIRKLSPLKWSVEGPRCGTCYDQCLQFAVGDLVDEPPAPPDDLWYGTTRWWQRPEGMAHLGSAIAFLNEAKDVMTGGDGSPLLVLWLLNRAVQELLNAYEVAVSLEDGREEKSTHNDERGLSAPLRSCSSHVRGWLLWRDSLRSLSQQPPLAPVSTDGRELTDEALRQSLGKVEEARRAYSTCWEQWDAALIEGDFVLQKLADLMELLDKNLGRVMMSATGEVVVAAAAEALWDCTEAILGRPAERLVVYGEVNYPWAMKAEAVGSRGPMRVYLEPPNMMSGSWPTVKIVGTLKRHARPRLPARGFKTGYRYIDTFVCSSSGQPERFDLVSSEDVPVRVEALDEMIDPGFARHLALYTTRSGRCGVANIYEYIGDNNPPTDRLFEV